ncbi:MAG TPA: cyclopropane-fatty-acyl-phospholipid synthase family protein [Pantanalinema sp.]
MSLEDQVARFIENLAGGSGLPLRIQLWNGRLIALAPDPPITITLPRAEAARYLLAPSLARLGEAYVEGHLQVTGSVWEILRLAETLSRQAEGMSRRKPWRPFVHSRKRDAEAIQYHYDVSNDFYRLWLDRNMVYSCGYFEGGTEDIHQAQEQKLDHICRKLLLQPGERFLDIGCGWGSLLRWAAKHYGVEATGITLSRNQFDYASALIKEEGLEDRCRVLLCDYRDLAGEGDYDKIASVGMFEHVGEKNLPLYFGVAHRLLRDGGLMLNHGIATSEANPSAHDVGAGEFIERYVFPYGETPALSTVIRDMGAQGLEILDVEGLRPHYAQTLMHWVSRLEANREAAIDLVGGKRYRIWQIYMAGCAHAFEHGWVSVYQLLVSKQKAGIPALPWSRAHLYTPRDRVAHARLHRPEIALSPSP